jgi:hypothetical protein
MLVFMPKLYLSFPSLDPLAGALTDSSESQAFHWLVLIPKSMQSTIQ